MKIECIGVLRWNGDTPDPVALDAAYNLADYGFFQRGTAKEFLTFAMRTLAKRLAAGVYNVDYEGKVCLAFVGADGLSGIAITDKEYPTRVAMSMLKNLIGEVRSEHPEWRKVVADGGMKIAHLEPLLTKYQDPVEVDKIAKLDKSLVETKEILTRTIEAVLERGEKLDDLVDRSAELSKSSKAFYKTAKKTNSCCIIM